MSNEINHAAAAVLREALDNVDVHPCDFSNDEVRAKGLYGPMAQLYQALWHPSPANGAVGEMPVAWIAPRLLESLSNYREAAQVPSNFSVAVQAGRRNDEDQPLYTAEQLRAAVLAEREAVEQEHKAEADNWREWQAMCRRVNDELPEGFLITYEMGPLMWGVSLTDQDGDHVAFSTDDAESDAEMVIDALEAAIRRALT